MEEPSQKLGSKFDPRLASAFDTKKLELILLSTEKCNYRCTYCYEDFAIGQMPPWIREGVKNLIKQRVADLNHLNIEWFGGEPLLAPKTVFEISEFAHDLCQKNNTTFTSAMTTNGSKLSVPTLRRLANCGVTHYQITLDGDRDVHNQTRLRANGSGSFDEIWSNLVNASSTDIKFMITLRLHVSQKNYAGIDSLVEKIHLQFGHDDRFSIFFHKINDLAGGTENIMSYDEYNTRVKALIDKVDQLWKKSKATSESDLPSLGYICYAAKPNSLLIRADGRIGKCTVAFDDDRNNLGSIRPDGTMEIDHQKLALWMAGFEAMDNRKLSCPLSKLGELPSKENVLEPDRIPVALVTT